MKKARTENFITRFARVYTPAVCYGALALAFVPPIVLLLMGQPARFGDWVYRALTFLVISCPCALVISIPLSFFGGIGGASACGILVKGSTYLEELARTGIVVFDKTGTLTQGTFKVVGIHPENGVTGDALVEAAALAESWSKHPISLSIKAAYGKPIDAARVTDVQELGGHGVTAKVDGKAVAAGNARLMKKLGLTVPAVDGVGTIVHVAVEGSYAGYLLIADVVKPHSADAIRALKASGVRKTVMLTGDAQPVAQAVAQQLGLDEYHAGLLPGDKVDQIETLLAAKQPKENLAFVGDGINDAPALAAADVGMAIGAGTDVAMESADIILMKNDLRDAVTAMKLSRSVIRNIKENLFWAFFYNCIGIPLAAGVLYPSFGIRLNPMFGAAAMSLSSIFVVGNALRLRGFKSGFTPLKTGTPEAARTEQETTQAAVEGEQCILEAPAEQNSKEEKERTNTMTKVISIEGMMCNHCTGTVQKALEAVEGVKTVTMSLEQKNATVELASDVADEVLTKAVVDAGYEVKGVTEK